MKIILVGLAACLAALAMKASAAAFDVKTSIQMTTLSSPDQLSVSPKVQYSPDGKYFIVVSSKGDLVHNEIVSTLRLYKTDDVVALVRGRAGIHSSGVILSVIAANPQVPALQAYAAVISATAWTPDSHSILYLAENSVGERVLRMVDIANHKDVALTPPGYDVHGFDANSAVAVYSATNTDEIRQMAERRAGSQINANAWNITGQPVWSVLKINTDRGFVERVDPVFHLGVVDLKSPQPLAKPSVRGVQSDYVSKYDLLSLSPDGSIAIQVLPWPDEPAWSNYDYADASFAVMCAGKRNDDPASLCFPKTYVATDLRTGHRTTLLKAPFGVVAGFPELAFAKWFPDGRHILLTGTFLPFENPHPAKNDPRRKSCVAAILDRQTHETTCLKYSTYNRDLSDTDKAKSVLEGADIVDRGRQIDLTSAQGGLGIVTVESFRVLSNVWRRTQERTRPTRTDDQVTGNDDPRRLRVWIKQEMDQPPTLWASDEVSGKSVLLWNPNPQLDDVTLGHASVYHWKDRSGHEWTGGLVLPVGYVRGKRYPLIVQTYTFHQHEFLADGMDTTAEAAMAFANDGFVVLQIQKRFDLALTDQEASIQVVGFRGAVDQLTADGIIDPNRTGIIGFSRGCFYAISALIDDPSLFRAATVADGLDQSYMQHRIFEVSVEQDKPTYGASPDGKGLAKWLKLAPGFNLDRVHSPLRIEAIGPVSVLQEWELYSSLHEQKKPVDFIYFPDGQHILRKPLERLASQQGNVDWFRFWLQGYEDPDVSKREQYHQWERLCDVQVASAAGQRSFCVGAKK